MTHFVKIDIYCPVCGNELQTEYEDYRDVTFVGKLTSLPKPSMYLFCINCGWYAKDREALHQIQGALTELER